MMAVKEKDSVAHLPKYKAAKSLESVSRKFGFQTKEIIKLAGNENRLGCSTKVLDAIIEHQDEFSFYPDTNVSLLREQLAKKHNISPDNFVFGNGSFELISLIGEVYISKGDEVIYNDPSFGWYLNVSLKNEGNIIKIPVTENKEVDTDAILKHINERTKVIWLCNPNNPTGTLIAPEILKEFIEHVPKEVLIVLDEAYIDFIDGDYIDTVEFVKKYDNIILLRTFSKAYGLASFRIGYGIASLPVIENILKVKLPINLGAAAQIAAQAALEDKEFTDFVIRTNREQLQYYYTEFEKLHLKYIPSHGNFILVNIGISSSFAEQEFLKKGIIIRNGEEFGLPEWLRISVGRPEENKKVIEVLQNLLNKEEIS
jgi:histidinol-phosphate aminotransferase